LGEKIKEATVQKWHVQVGDTVDELQTLADVSTDKLFTPLPAPYEGKIIKIMVDEGNECNVGSVLLEMEVEESELTELDLSIAMKNMANQSTKEETNGEVTHDNKKGVARSDKIVQE